MKRKDSILKQSISKASRGHSMSVKSRGTKSVLINVDGLAEPFVTIPPDGGWGWVVVTVSALLMFSIDGIGYCFSLFFETIREEFHCEITEVAIVSSMIGGFYYLAGPITCSLVNRCGFQLISVIGGAVASISFLTASFTTSLLPFVILVGFGGGSSFNLLYTPSVIAIGFYFEKWRALAMAICCCGSSLGVMSFPIIMVHLFGNMHWRIIFRIIAGLLATCGLLALTYKPIKSIRVEKTVQFGEVSIASYNNMSEKELNMAGATGLFQRFRNTFFPRISEVSVLSEEPGSAGFGYFIHNDDDEAISNYTALDSSVDNVQNFRSSFQAVTSPAVFLSKEEKEENDGYFKKIRKSCKRCWKCCQCSRCCMNIEDVSFTNVNRPLYKDDIFYSGSVYTLAEYPKPTTSPVSIRASKVVPSLAYTLSVSRAATQRDLLQEHQCVCCPEAVVRVLATMLKFQMLKSPSFIILLISGYLSLMATYIVFTYLPTYMTTKGIDAQFSKMILSVIGISNTVGRAACGVVSCVPVLNATVVSLITISISGIVVILSTFAHSTTEYIIYYVIFGFCLGRRSEVG